MRTKYKHKIAFVVATRNRPREIQRMLNSIQKGTTCPDEIIVVDGGDEPIEFVVDAFPRLKIRYLRCIPPSCAKQRNLGIRSVSEGTKLIGFLDDDITLQPEALERMMDFWNNADENLGGVAFNMINHPRMDTPWLKSLKIVESLGLYSSQPGMVTPSGFQTMIGALDKTTRVQWLPTGASVFRRDIFSKIEFDEWFKGYSYLEDLDFSYRLGKKSVLAVIAEAGYFHFPGFAGRGEGVMFGCREVINRIHFVRKNSELSIYRCWLGLIIRLGISLVAAFKSLRYDYWQRVFGNLLGFASIIMRRKQDTGCESSKF